MTKRNLDDAIDRAVRDIMSAEPRPGFRGRVRERITEQRGSGLGTRGSGLWPGSIPALAGAVAVFVIAFVLVQRGPQAPAPLPPTTLSRTVTAPSSPIPPAASMGPAETRNPPAQSGRRSGPSQRLETRMVRAASLEDPDDMLLEPLSSVAPLAIAAIDATRLATRDISIGELSIKPLTVEPLPPDGGSTSPREDR
jgi:hypothetical protein